MKGKVIKMKFPKANRKVVYTEKGARDSNLELIKQNKVNALKVIKMAERLRIFIKIDGIPFGREKDG